VTVKTSPSPGVQRGGLRWRKLSPIWPGRCPRRHQKLVVTCYDPDAPTGSGWWHWIVANIPADTRELPAGAGSGLVGHRQALQTRTDFGKAATAAAPPKGETHRYIFTVHALDVEKIEVDEGASGAMASTCTSIASAAHPSSPPCSANRPVKALLETGGAFLGAAL
jgi:Raf kinase inhibitor-like YbhB/YbcL family protein